MRIEDIRTGERRAFNFLPPYDKLLTNKTVYEVTKTYTLKSMLNDGFSPLENIYNLYEMEESDYLEDLNSNMIIVELTLSNERFYVPLDRIVSKDSESNVHYSERIIGIKIGFIPDNENLQTLLEDLELFVKESLGINPVLGDNKISASVSISESDHNDREAERNVLRGDPGNYKKKYYNCMMEKDGLLEKHQAVETALINGGAVAGAKPGLIDLTNMTN